MFHQCLQNGGRNPQIMKINYLLRTEGVRTPRAINVGNNDFIIHTRLRHLQGFCRQWWQWRLNRSDHLCLVSSICDRGKRLVSMSHRQDRQCQSSSNNHSELSPFSPFHHGDNILPESELRLTVALQFCHCHFDHVHLSAFLMGTDEAFFGNTRFTAPIC